MHHLTSTFPPLIRDSNQNHVQIPGIQAGQVLLAGADHHIHQDRRIRPGELSENLRQNTGSHIVRGANANLALQRGGNEMLHRLLVKAK